MARMNISVPDDVYEAVKELGLNASRLAADAYCAEIERHAKLREWDQLIAELEKEQGPTTDREKKEAETWADRVLAPVRSTGRKSRRSA